MTEKDRERYKDRRKTNQVFLREKEFDRDRDRKKWDDKDYYENLEKGPTSRK